MAPPNHLKFDLENGDPEKQGSTAGEGLGDAPTGNDEYSNLVRYISTYRDGRRKSVSARTLTLVAFLLSNLGAPCAVWLVLQVADWLAFIRQSHWAPAKVPKTSPCQNGNSGQRRKVQPAAKASSLQKSG